MKFDLKDVTETRKTLSVTLDASEVAAEEQTVLKQFSSMAKIPGFRPGKAPQQVVQKRFAKEMEGELKQRVLSKAYQDGGKEAKLNPITVVEVDEGTIVSGQEATVSFTIDVKPEFALDGYKGFELEGLSEEVADADIDETLENLRRDRAEFQPVERAAEKGDYVKFSHSGTIDGKAISEIAPDRPVYAKMPQTWEEVGGEQALIPGLADQLAGLKTGDKKDISVEFPAEFSEEALKGKKAVYAVEVLEVRERKLPELDEEFFKAQQVKDLDELKGRISTWLKSRKVQERRADLRRQVTEKVAALADFALPQSMVDYETENGMRQIVGDNVRRGIPQEELEKNKEAIHANAASGASARVKLQLILAQVAEKEKLEVKDQDFSRYIMNEAQRSGQKPEAFVKQLRKDQDRVRAIRQSLLFDKALEFLVDQAKVSDASAAVAEAK